MDFSNEYILMCVEADELQYNYEFKVGDYIAGKWFIDNNGNIGWTTLGLVKKIRNDQRDCGRYGYLDTGGDIFWDPAVTKCIFRQDQLQEIYLNWCDDGELKKSSNSTIVILDDFQDWVLNRALFVEFDSLEKYWLAFVMYKKYSKIWNGSIWNDCYLYKPN